MNIKDKIYEIRGLKVMIDRDLANLLSYETRILNQIVKRNIDKFTNEDYFQLNISEFNDWKSQNVISKEDKIGLRKIPFAFSKEGIRTLSTILRKENIKEIIDKILDNFDDKNELILSNNNALIPVNTGKFLSKHDI